MKYLPESTAAMGGYLLSTNGNVSDLLLTGSLYFINRMFGFSKKTSALASAGWMAAGEIAQGLGLLPGTYDPKDLLAIAAGTGLAIGTDALITRIRKNKGLETCLD